MDASEASRLAERTGGAAFAIDVYCDDESHAQRRWDITTFVIDPSHTPPTWGLYAESKKWRSGHGQQLTRAHADTRVVLRGNRRLTGDALTDDSLADPEVRVRYRLRCKLCGRSDEFRGEKMHVALDRMALGGVSHVSLARLAAILSG